MRIEPLESRIAPAALHGQVLTYTDIDGDHVTVTITKGTLAPSDFTFSVGSVDGTTGTPQQLEKIDLESAAGISGANIVAKAARAGGGDGRVNIGDIDAANQNLGTVSVTGDLAAFSCGTDATAGLVVVKTLSVGSAGIYGSATQEAGDTLGFHVNGSIGTLRIMGDVVGEPIDISGTGFYFANAGAIFVGGSVIGAASNDGIFVDRYVNSLTILGSIVGPPGSSATQSGDVSATLFGSVMIGGSIMGGGGTLDGALLGNFFGRTKIGHDLDGGQGEASGVMLSGGGITSLTIGGSIIGGSGADDYSDSTQSFAGQLASLGNIGSLSIGGSVVGGSGAWTGRIHCAGAVSSISIGGSLIGGPADQTGTIAADNDAPGAQASIGSVKIAHSLVSGNVGASGTLTDSGEIYSAGDIGAVTIAGDCLAGLSAGGTLDSSCASIRAAAAIGPIKIGGSMLGNGSGSILILANGPGTKPASGSDLAIASLTVGGSVNNAEILAGFDLSENPSNADASIGQVKVGHDWIASNLVAGAQDTGNDGWGVNDSLQTSNNQANLVASIAGISIGGTVEGLRTTQNFGFVAQQIDSFLMGGRMLPLTHGPSNDDLSFPLTAAVHVEEVS